MGAPERVDNSTGCCLRSTLSLVITNPTGGRMGRWYHSQFLKALI
ncbi:MAG: hypothetical protein AAF915_16940 [Cyanobacteria bacterium P01_D01_bin.50]